MKTIKKYLSVLFLMINEIKFDYVKAKKIRYKT